MNVSCFQDEPKAFVIDERTFYNIGEDGKMLDDDLELDAAAVGGESSKMVIDASVFDVDDAENLPDSETDDDDDDDDDDEEGDDDGDENAAAKEEAQSSEDDDDESGRKLAGDVKSKLKI